MGICVDYQLEVGNLSLVQNAAHTFLRQCESQSREQDERQQKNCPLHIEKGEAGRRGWMDEYK